jgi:hypothetical protein
MRVSDCYSRRRQFVGRYVPWLLLLWGIVARASDISVQFANLHNPYFPDRLPTARANRDGNYEFAPAAALLHGVEGDTLPVAFTVVSPVSQDLIVSVRLFHRGKEVEGAPAIRLLRAGDVRVEGNSNGNCSCPASRLPQRRGARIECVLTDAASEDLTPPHCPTGNQRSKIAATLVRAAPFLIKDPLEPVNESDGPLKVEGNVTELFVAEVPIVPELPKETLEVRVTAKPQAGARRTVVRPLKVHTIRLEGFPAAELSYWLSEDPRDLVSKPASVPLNGRWGGEWWSEEHWKHIEHAADLQARLGVTSTLVPLFVRNPFGIGAKPLIPITCITGEGVASKPDELQGQDNDVGRWTFDFDFANFHRWINVFRRAGFRQFEGAHLMANSGELPVELECDLRPSRDAKPLAREFRFLPRAGAKAEIMQKELRARVYRERFLPAFLQALHKELTKAGVVNHYVQHVIDENAPSDDAFQAYTSVVAQVREHLPRVRIIDAVNQYKAPAYRSLIDLPVIHLALLYDDQMRQKNIRKELAQAFPGRKYFYNTALREGGPNRFIDTNPLESRAYGWQLLELGYNGILYWAANAYRYPSARDLAPLNRPADWSPSRYSQGPLPRGSIEPGLAAGSNWILYPRPQGLIDSLRARRLRDGLMDHWLYQRAWIKCSRDGTTGCQDELLGLRRKLSRDTLSIADFSKDPAAYDEAREAMLGILEH